MGQCCSTETEDLEDAEVDLGDDDTVQLLTKGDMTSGGTERHCRQFEITMHKAAEHPLGAQCDMFDQKSLVIKEIKDEGVLATYNRKVSRHSNKIAVGDQIAEVNGVKSDSRALLDELQKGEDMKLVVRRPQPFTVTLKKPLGLKVVDTENCYGLLVKDIQKEGAVFAWNDENPECPILLNDRILKINEVEYEDGGNPGLMNALKEEEKLEILVHSYALPEPEEEE